MSLFDALPLIVIDALAVVGVATIVALFLARRAWRESQGRWMGA